MFVNRRRLWSLLLCVLLVAGLFAGCAQETAVDEPQEPEAEAPAETEGPPQGGTVRLAMWSSPAGLFNPVFYSDQYDANIISLVFDSLYQYNVSMEQEPALAESWEFSNEGKTVTFKLREDVVWHDGEPFTAEDVAFTFEIMCHPDYSGPRGYSVERLEGYYEYHGKLAEDSTEENPVYEIEPLTADSVAGIKVVDPYTISFTATEEYASFMDDLSYGIVPKHVLGEVPVSEMPEHDFSNNPIGTGAFKFVEYKRDQYATFEAFDDYYEGRPNVDQVVYKITNQEVALMELETGELDVVDVTPQDFDMVQEWEGVELHEAMELGYQYMAINHDREIFQDQNVRQALIYAIDREGIVDNCLLGHGQKMNAPVSPLSWAYNPEVNDYPYDPEKAKSLLNEAGWTMGDDGVMTKDGERFEVTLMYPTGNKVREQSAPIIKENLKEVGIDVELSLMDFPSMREKAINGRDFDLCLIGWSLSPDPDASFAFHSRNDYVGGWNYIAYHNERNDTLLDAGVATTDMEARKEIYQEWTKLMNEDLPYIFLYAQNKIHGVNSRIKGFDLDWRDFYHNLEDWYIEETE